MKKMNVPNKLTVLRICLVPIIVIISLINIPGEFLGIPVLANGYFVYYCFNNRQIRW